MFNSWHKQSLVVDGRELCRSGCCSNGLFVVVDPKKERERERDNKTVIRQERERVATPV